MSTQHSFPKTVNMPTQCPFCGKDFDYTLYPEIQIPGDSKLKKKILNKTLFFPKCPYCNEEVKLKPKCIYHDENRKEWFIVTDTPDDDFETLMRTGDPGLYDVHSEDDLLEFMKGLYIRRVVHDVDSFREKILLSDYNYDDRIMELMKLSLSALLEKNNNMPVYRIFLEQASGNQLEFTAILGSHAPFEYVTVRTDAKVYTQYKNKYLDKLGKPEEDEYISTDQKWAARSGLLKDEDAGYIVPEE